MIFFPLHFSRRLGFWIWRHHFCILILLLNKFWSSCCRRRRRRMRRRWSKTQLQLLWMYEKIGFCIELVLDGRWGCSPILVSFLQVGVGFDCSCDGVAFTMMIRHLACLLTTKLLSRLASENVEHLTLPSCNQ